MKNLLIFVVFIVVGMAFGLYRYGGKLLLDGLNVAGSRALGAKFVCESVSIAPFAGHFSVGGVEIGNPEGFTTPDCFRVGTVAVDCDLRSFLGDVATIDDILIRGPEVTLEIGRNGSNVGCFLDRLKGDAGDSGAPPTGHDSGPPSNTGPNAGPTASPNASGGGKKFLVKRLVLEDVKVRLAQSALLSNEIVLVLPLITLENIGNASGSGGPLPVDLPALLEQVLGSISLAASGSGGLPAELAGLLQGEANAATLANARNVIHGLRDALENSVNGSEKGLGKDLKKLEKNLDSLLGGDDEKKRKKKDKKDKKDG